MKKQNTYILLALMCLLFSSCVTGNDDNEVLREHEMAIAKTARVLQLKVNGEEISRDSLSNWREIEVNPGDQLTVTAVFDAGTGASEGNLLFSQYLYNSSTPFGVSADEAPEFSILETMTFGSGSEEISFTVAVPQVDADGAEFHSGDHINYAFWTWNDLKGYGYNDFTVEIK